MHVGNWLIGIGVVIIIIGILYKSGLLNWVGDLPGDISYEGKGMKIYFPLMTMIVISIALSLLITYFRR